MSLSRYLASLPERIVRSAAALVGGTVHETAQVLLPRLVRRSRLYEATASPEKKLVVTSGFEHGTSLLEDPKAKRALTDFLVGLQGSG